MWPQNETPEGNTTRRLITILNKFYLLYHALHFHHNTTNFNFYSRQLTHTLVLAFCHWLQRYRVFTWHRSGKQQKRKQQNVHKMNGNISEKFIYTKNFTEFQLYAWDLQRQRSVKINTWKSISRRPSFQFQVEFNLAAQWFDDDVDLYVDGAIFSHSTVSQTRFRHFIVFVVVQCVFAVDFHLISHSTFQNKCFTFNDLTNSFIKRKALVATLENFHKSIIIFSSATKQSTAVARAIVYVL